MVILIIIGIVMHQNNTITVFVDYTDAALSLAALVLPWATLLAIAIFSKTQAFILCTDFQL